jgi:polysaccharide pyruvyl transferase WcaK-like protein
VTKVLILNADSTNKGNQALATWTMEAIRRFVPEAEFVLMGKSEVNTPEL